MQEERLTDELLEELLNSATPDAYLDSVDLPDRTLADYLNELLVDRDLAKSQVIARSGMNATHVYHAFNGERMLGRDNAIMLAFALECELQEAQRLLRLDGVAELWCKVPRDAVIIFCLDHHMTREQCDDELFARDMPTLLKVEDKKSGVAKGDKLASRGRRA